MYFYDNNSGPFGNSSHGQLRTPPAFNDAPVDLLSVHFTGRQTEVNLIAWAFGRPRRNTPLRCVLFGDQGVGKSQLTYQWSKSTFERKETTYVIWMSATTIEKLEQGFSKILHLINHPDRSHPEQAVRLTTARRWLEDIDSGNWLLVLDNVFPGVLVFLREHLPRRNERGSILFTTRTENVAIALANAAGEQHEIIPVSTLSVQDGVQLFLGHFRDSEVDIPSIKAELIVKSVGCLPLAISHAAAFMEQSASTVDEMLALYEGEDKINVIGWENTVSEYEHRSVAATFEHQLQDLERSCSDANHLFKVLAYFNPECIPLDMLVDGAISLLESQNQSSHFVAPVPQQSQSVMQKVKHKVLRRAVDKGKGRVDETNIIPFIPPMWDSLLAVVKSPIRLRSAIMDLQIRSLAAYQGGSHSTLRIHDLIQLVVLEKTRKITEEQRECFELAVELASRAFKQIKDPRSPASWPRCEELIPHIQALTARQEISHEAKAKLLDANSRRGWYMRSRGWYREAEEVLVRVLADEEQLLGLEDLCTLGTMHRLAAVYRDQARYVDAETLLMRVLQTREKLHGSEHLETLDTMHMLALVYRSQGLYTVSEELSKMVLTARETQLGLDHIDTLDTKNVLADVYLCQKQYREAETLYEEVLQSMERILGPDHVETARIMNNLALVYLDQEHYSDAEELLKRVLRIWEKQLGSNHPNTLVANHNLARVYEAQGQYNVAEELLVHVLEWREKLLGFSHPRTQYTADTLASLYEQLGRSDDAATVRRRADERR